MNNCNKGPDNVKSVSDPNQTYMVDTPMGPDHKNGEIRSRPQKWAEPNFPIFVNRVHGCIHPYKFGSDPRHFCNCPTTLNTLLRLFTECVLKRSTGWGTITRTNIF